MEHDPSFRLNRVQFATPNGVTQVSWGSREILLELLAAEGCTKEIDAVRGPGTSRPIELEGPMGGHVVSSVILGNERQGRELPEDLLDLRRALADT